MRALLGTRHTPRVTGEHGSATALGPLLGEAEPSKRP